MSHKLRRKRLRYSHRRRNPPGSAPGTLTADPTAQSPQVALIEYSSTLFREQVGVESNELLKPTGTSDIQWLNVEGLGDIKLLQAIGEKFGLHPLALEDAINVHQRPKFEDYQGHLFLIVRMPVVGPAEEVGSIHRFRSEQVSIYVGQQFVITLQEISGDSFDAIRKRLRTEGSNIRRMGSDYLAYALIDSVIDAYFPVLEQYGELVEELEIEVIDRPSHDDMFRIHALKRDLLSIRRAIWPMRDMLSSILRDESSLLHDSTRIYLRDCHDHTIQLIDMVETYRELTSGLVDLHLSSVSNRMNEVMKVLTIIATIFIPLTFIAGIYGMNFDPDVSAWNMPELKSPYGYVGVMATMAAIAFGLLGWFRYKGWLGNGASSENKSSTKSPR